MTRRATRIEHRITLHTDPTRVFDSLTDPNYMPHFAPGIEAAEVVEEGSDGLVGARLRLGTRSGRTLNAVVKEYRAGRLLRVEDENGLESTWTVEPNPDGRVVLTNTLVGELTEKQANRLRYATDEKFLLIAERFEEDEPHDPRHSSGGATRITGTPRTPE